MKRHRMETRLMPHEEAMAFLQNMRWFTGMGPIKITPAYKVGWFSVKASVSAWSNWAE